MWGSSEGLGCFRLVCTSSSGATGVSGRCWELDAFASRALVGARLVALEGRVDSQRLCASWIEDPALSRAAEGGVD